MAFPTIVGTPTESATTTAGTSHVVNLPSGASGNLFLLVMGKGSTAATINALTGWTELVDENAAWGTFVAWRTCDGTEGTTTTFTSSASTKSATIVYEISGQSAFAPEISAVGTGTSNAPNPNTCTPTGGAKDYLWITFFNLGGAGEEADDDTWCNNAATNYGSLRQKTAGVGGTNISPYIAACHRTNNASSEDAAWPSGSTDQSRAWRAWTIAVHPIQLVSADTGSYTQSGVAANLEVGRVLAGGAAVGSYAITGVDATLVIAAAGIDLTVDPGSYSASGVAATLVVDRALADGAAPGSYSLDGVAATLAADRMVSSVPGSYAATGFSATLLADRLLASGGASGTYELTGFGASLVVDRMLIAEPGSFTLTGVDVTLLDSGAGGGVGSADTITRRICGGQRSGYKDMQGY